MSRFIVTIRRPEQPTVYYLSKRGFRCYTGKNAAVFRTEAAARDEMEYFIKMMPDFRLSLERLPARLPVHKAILSAVPAEGGVS